MDLAESQGNAIRLGRSGFSIRFQRQPDVALTTFAYGFPPDRFEPYLRDMPLSPEDIIQLRREILATGVFEESGQHTLRCLVSDETLPKALMAFELLLASLKNE